MLRNVSIFAQFLKKCQVLDKLFDLLLLVVRYVFKNKELIKGVDVVLCHPLESLFSGPLELLHQVIPDEFILLGLFPFRVQVHQIFLKLLPHHLLDLSHILQRLFSR